MGPVTRKPVFGVSDKARLKPVPSTTGTSYKFEISLLSSLDMILKKKAYNKEAEQSAQMRRLVCAFVVLHTTEDRFSRVKAHKMSAFKCSSTEKQLKCRNKNLEK